MKIGIITAHAKYLYDTVLSAYAIQEFLRKEGHLPEIIDYRPAVFTVWNDAFPGNAKRRNKNYEAFAKRCLNLSETIRNKAGSMELEGRYDLIIAAGPCIWDGAATRGLKPVYFACFDQKAKKAACAISIRSNQAPAFEEEFCRKYIKEYTVIGACDNKIAERLQQYTEVAVTAQRSLLLLAERETYRKLAQGYKTASKPYVFLYATNKEMSLRTTAKKLCAMAGIPVIHNCPKVKLKEEVKNIAGCAPEMVPAYIAEAEYVVTDSPQTALLALMFEKKLLLLPNGEEGERLIELAEAYGLNEMLIKRREELLSLEQTKPDYAVVKPILQKETELLRRTLLASVSDIG